MFVKKNVNEVVKSDDITEVSVKEMLIVRDTEYKFTIMSKTAVVAYKVFASRNKKPVIKSDGAENEKVYGILIDRKPYTFENIDGDIIEVINDKMYIAYFTAREIKALIKSTGGDICNKVVTFEYNKPDEYRKYKISSVEDTDKQSLFDMIPPALDYLILSDDDAENTQIIIENGCKRLDKYEYVDITTLANVEEQDFVGEAYIKEGTYNFDILTDDCVEVYKAYDRDSNGYKISDTYFEGASRYIAYLVYSEEKNEVAFIMIPAWDNKKFVACLNDKKPSECRYTYYDRVLDVKKYKYKTGVSDRVITDDDIKKRMPSRYKDVDYIDVLLDVLSKRL